MCRLHSASPEDPSYLIPSTHSLCSQSVKFHTPAAQYRMLVKNHHKRATIPELLAHPWLALSSDSNAAASDSASSSAAIVVPSAVPNAVVVRLRNFAAMNRFKKEARKVCGGRGGDQEGGAMRWWCGSATLPPTTFPLQSLPPPPLTAGSSHLPACGGGGGAAQHVPGDGHRQERGGEHRGAQCRAELQGAARGAGQGEWGVG